MRRVVGGSLCWLILVVVRSNLIDETRLLRECDLAKVKLPPVIIFYVKFGHLQYSFYIKNQLIIVNDSADLLKLVENSPSLPTAV